MNEEIERAEQEIIVWSKRSLKDFRFYVGLSQAMEHYDKLILKLIIEIRYNSPSG